MTAIPDRPDPANSTKPILHKLASPAETDETTTGQITHSLERIEGLLSEIRASLDADAREAGYQSGSLLPLAAAVLQVLAGGAVALALIGALMSEAIGLTLVKLGFAAVFQIAALTAILAARSKPGN